MSVISGVVDYFGCKEKYRLARNYIYKVMGADFYFQ